MSHLEILSLKFIGILLVCAAIIAVKQPDEQGYSQTETAAMYALVVSVDAPRFKTKQAAALADLWQISDAEIAKPVNLWRAK